MGALARCHRRTRSQSRRDVWNFVGAEHGLGKRKAHLLNFQYGPEHIAAMKAVKQRFDPHRPPRPGHPLRPIMFTRCVRPRIWACYDSRHVRRSPASTRSPQAKPPPIAYISCTRLTATCRRRAACPSLLGLLPTECTSPTLDAVLEKSPPMLAQMVGIHGKVTGIDVSRDQLEQGRQLCARHDLTNVTFHEATAYATGLPANSFDVAYCRFLPVTPHRSRSPPSGRCAAFCAPAASLSSRTATCSPLPAFRAVRSTRSPTSGAAWAPNATSTTPWRNRSGIW